MSAIRIVRIIAGFFVLLATSLGMEGSPVFLDANWLWLDIFVGFNLFQSGFTKVCPLEIVLNAMNIE